MVTKQGSINFAAMGDFINQLLDNLLAVAQRLLDLPLYVLFPLLLMAAGVGYWLLRKLLPNKTKGSFFAQGYFFVTLGLLLVLVIDLKVATLKSEIEVTNTKYQEAIGQSSGDANQAGSVMRPPLYTLDTLRRQHPEFKIWERPIDGATDLLILRKESEPRVVIYLAIVDLSYPNLEVFITPEFQEKSLTSDFAKRFGCSIAINGEAGNTMYKGSGLGEWTGNWISKGKAVLQTDSDRRPFLSFDRFNHPKYFKASEVDTANTDEKYNTIWGRFDLLVGGAYQAPERDRPYARTIMAIDESGDRLFLLIADGKRPEYSIGLHREVAASLLQSLGASDGMVCDQGGSSCMYLSSLGGIINRPADSDGYERVVYSHFGLKVR
ncbi:MAG: phosphodiester glycosidase family protein [Salibacteraceae bacterium]